VLRHAATSRADRGLALFERVTVRASDLAASTAFYATVLAPIGGGAGDLAITHGDPPTQRLHIGFYVPSAELVHAFWEAGRAAGYTDDGEPGPRPHYGEDYYGGFLLDPDGNSAEAMTHDPERVQGQIDHLWIRVPDVAAARDEHRAACATAGYVLNRDTDDLVQFRSPGSSFSFVQGEPTRRVDLGFLTIP
jgi:catechol 2,3-dioxygenase-like lactoylglutathione lyase family enzyme